MPVIQSPGQRINNMRVIEFPLWLRIVCYIIAIIFVLWILRSVYKYIVYQKLIANRKNENAVLISKVKEAYREVKAYNTSLGSNRSTSNRGIAYRLYFDVNGKDVELDVDEKTFDNIKEGDKGVLDYKGCEFYSFTKE